MNGYEFVFVRWIDAATQTGWDRPDAIKIDDKYAYSPGYLLKDDGEILVLGADWDDDGYFNRFIYIPKVCVDDIIEVDLTEVLKSWVKK